MNIFEFNLMEAKFFPDGYWEERKLLISIDEIGKSFKGKVVKSLPNTFLDIEDYEADEFRDEDLDFLFTKIIKDLKDFKCSEKVDWISKSQRISDVNLLEIRVTKEGYDLGDIFINCKYWDYNEDRVCLEKLLENLGIRGIEL